MISAENLTLAAYFIVLIILAVYGWHRYYLVYLYLRNQKRRPHADVLMDPLPCVTIQLPLYNEVYVADRLIDTVCRIEYPRDRLEIQVLDDSTDETCGIAESAVLRLAARGHDVKYLHRSDRAGFKAGALEAGLKVARGEFVAIFDADFLPSSDFLTRLMPHFVDERVGMVQARWGHINQDYSLLTKVQSMLLDGHFVLEHGGRSRGGRFFNFNGTAGVWRRSAIDDAGGWQHDTLTEDLDLSYRAQLRGWRFVYVSDVVAPAEVPVEMNAFKLQQHRWAKGSIQTCRKLLPRILRSDLPWRVKSEAFFHLTANLNYPLVMLLSVLMLPSMMCRHEMPFVDIPIFFAATLSVCNFYMVGQREIYRDWTARFKYLPFLMSIGIGLSVNNTRAVLEALFNKETQFARTPKYRVEHAGDEWLGKRYRQAIGAQPVVECALGLYFSWVVLYAINREFYATVPFLMLFQVGFLYTGLVSFIQHHGDGPVVLNTEVAK